MDSPRQGQQPGPIIEAQPAESLQLVAELAVELRDALGDVCAQVLTRGDASALRGRDLVQRMGVDKSLASRIVRALNAAEPALAAQLLPSAEGVELVLAAAVRAGAEPLAAKHAREVSARFEAAVQEVPRGRVGLRAAFAQASDRQRATVERIARREMVRSLATLTGVWAEARYTMLAFAPGADGWLDMAQATMVAGLRRARPGNTMELMTLTGDDPNGPPKRTRLDGSRLDGDPMACLIEECSSKSADSLIVELAGRRYTVLLGPEEPPIDHPLDFAMGVKYLGFMPAREGESGRWGCVTMGSRRATELMVADVLLAPGVLEGKGPPRVVYNLDTVSVPDPKRGPDPNGRETLDLDARFESMGQGLSRPSGTEADRFTPVCEGAFKRLGWELGAYRRYRLEIAFPVPLTAVEIWFDLGG
jgi:hypothetical protein